MTQWRKKSAADQGRAIARGDLDPVALCESYLEAIAQHPDGARIYARTTAQRALGAARATAKRAQAGMLRGPLDGVPLSWKDLFDTAGIVTEGGSQLLAGRVPEKDALVLCRADQAGFVCLGKTHTSELAFSGLGVNPKTATPPNSFVPDLAPGGSSSGAAVSVALDLAAAAIGTDTNGSVRIPAAWNGLVGLKTTAGLIPNDGVLPLSRSLDTIGPMTRTVEDAALLFAVLAACPPPDFAGAEPGDERLVIPDAVVCEGCDDTVLAAFEDAVAKLGAAGVPIARAAVPELAQTFETMAKLGAIVNTEGWAQWGALIEANPGVMFPLIEARFRQGATAGGDDAAARRAYARLSHDVAARMDAHGLLLMPSVACVAPPVARLLAEEAFYNARNLLALRNTRLANLLGLCAVTIPTPVPMTGLMIMGPPRQEARILRLGQVMERILAA